MKKAYLKTRRLNVVFAADDRYIPHLAVAVTSLLENNPFLVDRIFVLTDADNGPQFQSFASDVRERYGITPEVAHIDSSVLGGFYVSGHVSSATYNRFLLGDVLPHEIESVLYLDCDLVVVGDLSPLLERIDEFEVADGPVLFAVPRDDGSHLIGHGHQGARYFNAGVIFVNLRAWRQRNVVSELFAVAQKLFGKLHLWDQDVLNLVLEHEWAELPGIFNETNLTGRSVDARIVHFVGGTKPWMVGGNHPYRPDYDKYRERTPFWPYRKEGTLLYLKKILIPRPLQRPRRTMRRIARKFRRIVSSFTVNWN